MNKKIKQIFYFCDFSGLVPQFRILNDDIYRSIFSCSISIIIILFSIIFTIISINNYFKFNNPSISYLKRFDNAENRTILLKDTFLMFLVQGYSLNDYEPVKFDYHAYYSTKNGSVLLDIENCEIEKNIDKKFNDTIYQRLVYPLNRYYCISQKHGDLPLSYDPGDIKNQISQLLITITYNYSKYDKIEYFVEFITQNDIIDHLNKNNPIKISSYYYQSDVCYSNSYLNIYYNFECIKYETDYGYFFHNSKDISAISFSDLVLDKFYKDDNYNKYFKDLVSIIRFGQTEKYYSHYKKNYQKVQSLLAEIMSIINILIGIARLSANILLQKKMSKDIIRSMIKESDNIKYKKNSLIEKNYKANKLFKNKKGKIINSERTNINKELSEKSNVLDKSNKIEDIKMIIEKKKSKENKDKMVKVKVLKNINFFDVMKSYICYKTRKIKLINICHNIVMKDLCIDRMLYRLYELEKLFFLLSKEDQFRLSLKKDKKIEEVFRYIKYIYKEEKQKVETEKNKVENEMNNENNMKK